MATTIADIRNLSPEFRDTIAIPDSEVQAALTHALGEIDITGVAWGTASDRAVALYTCHVLAVSHTELSQNQKVRIYETPGAEEAGALGVTRYGREFVRLRDSQLKCRLPLVSSAGPILW